MTAQIINDVSRSVIDNSRVDTPNCGFAWDHGMFLVKATDQDVLAGDKKWVLVIRESLDKGSKLALNWLTLDFSSGCTCTCRE